MAEIKETSYAEIIKAADALQESVECFIWERTNRRRYGALEKGDAALAQYKAAKEKI